MSLPKQVGALFAQRAIRRRGIVGELVNAARINLFQISGGDILARAHGRFTADVGANATTLQLFIMPDATVMATPAQQALSGASGNLTGLIQGRMLEPTGAIAVAIAIEAANYGVGLLYQPTNWWVLTPGIVNMLVGGATTTTGAIDWFLSFIPLDSNAIVRAM